MNCGLLSLSLCQVLCYFYVIGLSSTSQRLCGWVLSDTLSSLCTNGFHSPTKYKRSGFHKALSRINHLTASKRTGVADECCLRGCTVDQLRQYCINGTADTIMTLSVSTTQQSPTLDAIEESRQSRRRPTHTSSSRVGYLALKPHAQPFFYLKNAKQFEPRSK